MITNRSSHPYNVLVALDGSTAAATAIPLARLAASQLGAGVEVLHIVSAAGEPRLTDTTGLRVHRIVGDPADEIVRIASDPAVALMVLTTHGHAATSGARLGHVAERVIANSTVPLLLVRPEAAAQMHVRPLRRLLVPLDGTPSTARALHHIATLLRRLDASLDLLLIAAPSTQAMERGSIGVPRYIDQPQHELPEWADEVYERLCVCCAGLGADIPTQVFVAHGAIGDEVIRIATAHEHDAIVLVRRSHLEPRRAQVLREVLARTPCPILLVGAPSH
jgi:nucleotide-binding universal stress UspA family protein